MKILVCAAHPDDAETSVGGSICRYAQAGHQVHVVNLTNARTSRVECARRASAVLGCTCEFLDFTDVGAEQGGDRDTHLGLCFDERHLGVVIRLLQAHHPDLVWAHWPVDTHPDHMAAGVLVMRACDNTRLQGDWRPDLWFFAPALGYQAVCFQPDHYEDITPYVERKKQAVALYDAVVPILQHYVIEETSQQYHGYVSGFTYAEAFCKCHFRVGRERYEIAGGPVDEAVLPGPGQ